MVTPEGLIRIRWNPEVLNLKVIQVSRVMGSQGDNALLPSLCLAYGRDQGSGCRARGILFGASQQDRL